MGRGVEWGGLMAVQLTVGCSAAALAAVITVFGGKVGYERHAAP